MSGAARRIDGERLAGDPAAASEWREHWTVVLAAGLCLSIATVPYVTVGVFMLPLIAEFGWSRTAISLAVPISGLTIALLSPFVGQLVDRFGARRIGLPGGLAVCLAFAGLSFATASPWSYWALWGILALAIAAASPLVWTTAVASRFRLKRGSALAMVLCGTSLAQALAVPTAMALIETVGWRMAYVTIGLGVMILTLPVGWCYFYDARDLALRDRARNGDRTTGQLATIGLSGVGLREALRARPFWLIAMAVLLGSSAVLGGIVHFVPMHVDNGFTPMVAASVAVAIPLSGATGKLLCGVLLDRFPPTLIGMAIFLSAAAAFVILMSGGGHDWTSAVLIACLLGLAGGAEVDLVAFLTAHYFGLRAYGAIYGLLFATYQIGISISPVLLSVVRDANGGYGQAFPYMFALAVIAALLMLGLGGRGKGHEWS